jgi:hypothetical protein
MVNKKSIYTAEFKLKVIQQAGKNGERVEWSWNNVLRRHASGTAYVAQKWQP